MAKDIRNSSKRSDQGPKRRKCAADYRASNRIRSAASAGRKKAAGMSRVSVWVPSWAEEILKRFAKRLREGRVSEAMTGAQAGELWLSVNKVVSIAPRRKRKAMPCDDRQPDLFGPA